MFVIIHAQAFGAPGLAGGESWALTRAMSPRPSVRLADVDAYGQVMNIYGSPARVVGVEPGRPWAVYLAGTDRRFRLLCFDLDAKTADAAAGAARDAEILVELLSSAGLEPVVCASGPTGGRHVWVGLVESVDADTVATLARFTQRLCPTLDIAPLMNPATGCVRPPGAPHRAGGHSTPISGDTAVLAAPTGTAASVVLVVERLAGLIDDAGHSPTVDPRKPLPLDKHARLYLPGPRQELPAVSAAALQEDAACGDASAVLWRVLIGAASARWRHADIAALVATSPGLEHIRTARDGGNRIPRNRADARRVLCRQWDKAVRHVATSDRRVGDDPTFDARADAIAAQVRHLQTRADSAAGRWLRGGGPADRRVLDVLCVLALQALHATVEADTRRLALLAGIGRETARTALLRLAEDGWITHTRAAEGPHGAHWQIAGFEAFHSTADPARSQADPRPHGAGPAERTLLLADLTARTAAAAHDVFTPSPALGLLAGNIYARTTTDPQTADALAHTLGATPEDLISTLHQLAAVGLLIHTRNGWQRHPSDPRAVAQRLDVGGRLEERRRRYDLERVQWAWWQAEQAWMHAPRRAAATRRAGPLQLALLPEDGTHAYGPYPRRRDGTADHKAATREIDALGGKRIARRERATARHHLHQEVA